MTALANAISGATGQRITPADLNSNSNTGSFESVYGVKVTPLHGGKLKPSGDRVGIQMDPTDNITGDSGSGVLSKIRQSLRDGKPVVIGLTKANGRSADPNGYDRHSVVAYGISAEGKILVYDPARGAVKGGSESSDTASAQTLDATMKYWGETHIDFANAVESNPTARPNPQPGPGRGL
jgi:hypothetical protein